MRWASILPILGFLGLSVLALRRGTRHTDRQTDRRAERQTDTARYFIMPLPVKVGGITNIASKADNNTHSCRNDYSTRYYTLKNSLKSTVIIDLLKADKL